MHHLQLFCLLQNYAVVFNIDSASKIFPSNFVSVTPITDALNVFAMNTISSIFGKRLFILICNAFPSQQTHNVMTTLW